MHFNEKFIDAKEWWISQEFILTYKNLSEYEKKTVFQKIEADKYKQVGFLS